MTVSDFDDDNSKGKADTVASYGITNASGVFTIENTSRPRARPTASRRRQRAIQRSPKTTRWPIEQSDPDLLELDPLELNQQ